MDMHACMQKDAVYLFKKREESTIRLESNAYKVSKISFMQVNRRKKKSSKTKKR